MQRVENWAASSVRNSVDWMVVPTVEPRGLKLAERKVADSADLKVAQLAVQMAVLWAESMVVRLETHLVETKVGLWVERWGPKLVELTAARMASLRAVLRAEWKAEPSVASMVVHWE